MNQWFARYYFSSHLGLGSQPLNIPSYSLAETSLGVPDFSEIMGSPLEASLNLAVWIGLPGAGFSVFLGLPSALDLSKDPEVMEEISMDVLPPPVIPAGIPPALL